jgi:hypothetical protein
MDSALNLYYNNSYTGNLYRTFISIIALKTVHHFHHTRKFKLDLNRRQLLYESQLMCQCY